MTTLVFKTLCLFFVTFLLFQLSVAGNNKLKKVAKATANLLSFKGKQSAFNLNQDDILGSLIPIYEIVDGIVDMNSRSIEINKNIVKLTDLRNDYEGIRENAIFHNLNGSQIMEEITNDDQIKVAKAIGYDNSGKDGSQPGSQTQPANEASEDSQYSGGNTSGYSGQFNQPLHYPNYPGPYEQINHPHYSNDPNFASYPAPHGQANHPHYPVVTGYPIAHNNQDRLNYDSHYQMPSQGHQSNNNEHNGLIRSPYGGYYRHGTFPN